jgi:hypothetical protein
MEREAVDSRRPVARCAPAAVDPATKRPRQKRAPRKAAQPKADGVRESSTIVTSLALIQRPEGATLFELMTAASWQAHGVRGFISGTLGALRWGNAANLGGGARSGAAGPHRRVA